MPRFTTTSAAILLAAAASTASADKYGFYSNEDHQQWGLTNMPDFDQVRAPIFDLPGLLNDGRMFCVPTSTMNAFAYIARHGDSNVQPGVEAWDDGSQANYIASTFDLTWLGGFMGTGGGDGLGGTSAQGWYDGTRLWLDEAKYDVHQRLALSNHDTTTREIANIGRAGGLIMACYGRWENTGSTLTDRTGGHCVTATRVDIDSPIVSEFRYRNPSTGSSESMFHQDDFRYSTIDCTDATYTWDGEDYTFSRMEFSPGPDDTRVRLLDFLGVIFAKEGLTNWPAGSVSKLAPNPIDPSTPQITTFAAPGPVICCKMAPGRTHWALMVEPSAPGGPNRLEIMNPEDGSTHSISGLASPSQMVFCRRGYLNIIDGRDLVQLDLRQRSPEVGRTTLPSIASTIKDLAYDDEADEIVVLTDTQLVRYGFDLSGPGVDPLPPAAQTREHVLLARQVDVPSIVVGDANGIVRLTRDASGALQVGQRASFPAGETMSSMSAGNSGEVHATTSAGQRILSLEEETDVNGNTSFQFVILTDPMFDGFPTGSQLAVSRSRTNYDERTHGTPGWNTNILAEDLLSVPERRDCPSDFNNDDVSDVLDLLDFLVQWFANDPSADFNLDQTTDVLDLLDFLSAWFDGCDAA